MAKAENHPTTNRRNAENLFCVGDDVAAAGLIKYPQIHVQLVGEDGNAFAILGRVCKAMRKAGVSKAEIDQFQAEAMAGDYDALLATCMRWVRVS